MQQNQITSIIDNCDLKTAFSKIIYNFDPNKTLNKKTKILDNTSFLTWNENDYRIFDITKTRNLQGFVLDNHYDIIITETLTNKSFLVHMIENSKIFSKILNKDGIVIVRVNNFQLENELKGTYDINTIFKSNNFFLINQIIYKYPYNNYNNRNSNIINNIKNIHTTFLIFKQKLS